MIATFLSSKSKSWMICKRLVHSGELGKKVQGMGELEYFLTYQLQLLHSSEVYTEI